MPKVMRLSVAFLLLLTACSSPSVETSTTTVSTARVSTTNSGTVTTFTTTTTPTTTTTTTSTSTTLAPSTTVGADLALTSDGLGVVSFGADPDETVAVLTGLLGPPSFDTGWGDPSDSANQYLWPGCPGSIARIVSWEGSLGAVFTDWDSASGDMTARLDEPVFAGAGLWRDSAVGTEDGIFSGDTLGRLREVYGPRLFISDVADDAVGLFWFAIDGDGSALARTGAIRGWLFWPEYPVSPAAGAEPAGRPTDAFIAAGFTSGVTCDTP